MTMLRFEAGFVSTDRGLVDFLAEVFELDALEPAEVGFATVYRLQSPGGVLKVMVPNRPPEARRTGAAVLRPRRSALPDALRRRPEASSSGRRAGAVGRARATDIGPGARMAVLEDPDGNPFEVVQAPSA